MEIKNDEEFSNPYPTCHHCGGKMNHTLSESWCKSCGFISNMYESGWIHEGDEDNLRDYPPISTMNKELF